MPFIPLILAVGLTVVAGAMVMCRAAESKPATGSAHDYTLKKNDGSPFPLEALKGKALLVVNTASKCGFTGQYEGLQELYKTYEAKDLVVIGVPSNDFMRQEPGTNEEILQFCSLNYGVTFPLMAKVVVKGANQDHFYAWLTTSSGFPGKISWNFNKFLINGNGQVVKRFGSRTKPAEMKQDIEQVLASLKE